MKEDIAEKIVDYIKDNDLSRNNLKDYVIMMIDSLKGESLSRFFIEAPCSLNAWRPLKKNLPAKGLACIG